MDFNSMASLPLDLSVLRRHIIFVAWLSMAFLTVGSRTVAQEVELAAAPQREIAATVDGTVITIDQVERDIARTLQGIKLTPSQKTEARAAALNKLINQRIVYNFLEKHGIAAGDEEVQLRLEELETELETVEKTIEDYLLETNQSLDEFRFQIAWQISWRRYLQRKLTDEFLESHFNENKRQMDGTELKVAHLLLKHQKHDTTKETENLVRQATTLVEQISNTSLTWDEAVARYSQAPTSDSGGLIGWIRFDGPMPKPFTRVAFELNAGEVSAPVSTKFGVHIIKCLEVREGKLGWRDIIDDVKKSGSRAYFDAIVKKHRPEVDVE